MKDAWVSRDLPVLDAVVGCSTVAPSRVSVAEASKARRARSEGCRRAVHGAGRPVCRGLYAGSQRAGYQTTWYVSGVTAEARRIVGQWPAAEGLAARLAEAFNQAADEEKGPGAQESTSAAGQLLGGPGKDLAAEIIAKVVVRQAGDGLRTA